MGNERADFLVKDGSGLNFLILIRFLFDYSSDRRLD